MLIIMVYATFSSRTNNVKIFQPSESQFHQFQMKYSDTLQCPCSQLSIQYDDFVRIDTKFHEVCQSQFVTQDWIDSVYHVNVSFIPPNDIRTMMSHFWQLVRAICTLSNDTWTDAYQDVNRKLFLSSIAQSELFLTIQVNASLNFSMTSALSNLKRNLLITRDITLANGLLSSLATNYYFRSVYGVQVPDVSRAQIEVQSFTDGCSCLSLKGCPQSAVLFDLSTKVIQRTIPGIIFNCLMFDAVLASSLECFYQSSCLSLLENETVIHMKVEPLRLSSRFSPRVTIEQLLNALMIEQMITKIDFSSYYRKCNPKFCTYSYTSRFNPLFMITMLISVFSGVSVLLKFLSPNVIQLAFSIYRWKKKAKSNLNENHQPLKHRWMHTLLSRMFSHSNVAANQFVLGKKIFPILQAFTTVKRGI
jgi:hypothetical protein